MLLSPKFLRHCLIASSLVIPGTGLFNVASAQAPAAVPQAAGLQPIQPQQAPQPPFQLTPQQQKYIETLLQVWSQKTQAIKHYQCDFKRWSFKGDSTHSEYAQGIIKFEQPASGLFKVNELYLNKGAKGQQNFQKVEGMFGEWWLCDGKEVHNYDRTNQTVDIYELPKEMQGVEIFNSPLPFLFGVDPAKIEQRYWIQPIQSPPGQDGQPRQDIVALEAYPKMMSDAQNYQKVRIYLDQKQALPVSLELFLPNWTEKSDHREVFEFQNAQVNMTLAGQIARLFRQDFIPMDPPKGWTVQRHPAPDGQPAQPVAGQNQPVAGQNPGPAGNLLAQPPAQQANGAIR